MGVSLHLNRLEGGGLRSTPACDRIDSENDERHPDKREGYHLGTSKRLMKNKNSEKEATAWRQVLQKSKCR
jgi:hypothetical protein